MKHVRGSFYYKFLFFVLVVLVLLLTFWIGKSIYRFFSPEDYFIEGIVETDEIDVAAKIPGRINKVLVDKGDSVKTGDMLVIFQSVEVSAKADQAEAAFNTAKSTYERFQRLYEEGVVSKQKADEVNLQYQVAKAQFSEAKSYLSEATVKSPMDGYVVEKIVNAGEVVQSGYPLLSIVRNSDYKVKIYADETRFGNLKINETLSVIIPALKNKRVEGKIAKIVPAADFAVKKATNEQGSYDMRAIEVEITLPESINNDLRNGMTARVAIK